MLEMGSKVGVEQGRWLVHGGGRYVEQEDGGQGCKVVVERM